jgi:hypothetical protein
MKEIMALQLVFSAPIRGVEKPCADGTRYYEDKKGGHVASELKGQKDALSL